MRKKHLNKFSVWQNRIRTAVRTVAISSGLVSSIFIILINIMGCSDSPYSSNMLTPEDVDRYLFAPDANTLCLTNGYDSKCITLVPNGGESRLPVIHIYPKKVVYVFYYEGVAVIRAERHRDDIIDPPIDDPPIDDDKEKDSGGNGIGPRDNVNGGSPDSGNNNNGNNNNGNNGNNNNGNNENNNNNENNEDSNNNGNNNDRNNGNNDIGRDSGTQTPSNNINPSGHNPPDNVLSHLIYGHADDNPEHRAGDGWIIWIYYPHNYVKDDNNDGIEDNPRGLGEIPIHPNTGPSSGMYPYGFTFSVSGGEVKSFSQTSGNCTDNRIGSPPDESQDGSQTIDNRAVGKDYRDDWNDTPCSSSGSDYSTQMFVKTSAEKITLTIRWTHGVYAPRTQTFNIMKEVNMKNYDEEGYDPGHLNQHRWDE